MRRSPGHGKNEKVIIEAIKLVTLQTPHEKRFKTSVPESAWETKNVWYCQFESLGFGKKVNVNFHNFLLIIFEKNYILKEWIKFVDFFPLNIEFA